jgi:hypothetical protein
MDEGNAHTAGNLRKEFVKAVFGGYDMSAVDDFSKS